MRATTSTLSRLELKKVQTKTEPNFLTNAAVLKVSCFAVTKNTVNTVFPWENIFLNLKFLKPFNFSKTIYDSLFAQLDHYCMNYSLR